MEHPKPRRMAAIAALVLATSLAIGPVPASAVRPTEPGGPGDRYAPLRAYTEGSKRFINHGPWQRFLDTYAIESRDGVVIAYDAVPTEGRVLLDSYLAFLQRIDWAQLDRREQLAAWINLHNAASVSIVLEQLPFRRVSYLKSPPVTERGPFAERRFSVEGVPLSCEEIAHVVLRGRSTDPRILYTLHGASLGGPRIAKQAYRGRSINRQLDDAARRFVNMAEVVERHRGALRVSNLYRWFRSDFGGDDAAILAHLRRYANRDTKALIANARRIDGYQYDWDLDARARKRHVKAAS